MRLRRGSMLLRSVQSSMRLRRGSKLLRSVQEVQCCFAAVQVVQCCYAAFKVQSETEGPYTLRSSFTRTAGALPAAQLPYTPKALHAL